jgi:transcriptional regulator GlxA family with amidase domain
MEQLHCAPDDIWRSIARTVVATMPRSRYARHTEQLHQCFTIINHSSPSDYLLLQTALHQLYTTKGQIRMRALATHCCLSLRHFERRFKQLTGMAPKTLARLIRFEATHDRLLHDPAPRLLDLACELGYTDQSHFTHDFTAIAACTPQAFLTLVSERNMSHFYYVPDPRSR